MLLIDDQDRNSKQYDFPRDPCFTFPCPPPIFPETGGKRN